MKIPRVIIVVSLLNLTFSFGFAQFKWTDNVDFVTYAGMADSFRETDKFLLPDGTPTHHFPPLWPMLLSPFPGLVPKLIAGIFYSWAALWAIYFTTRKLFGEEETKQFGLWLWLLPWFPMMAADGFSEVLVMATYSLCIFFLILSITLKEKYVILAAIFAGITYLLKASMGYFFLLSGACGLLWRIYHKGFKGITKEYAGAVGVFLLLVLPWTWRNIHDFGLSGWETQPYVTIAIKQAWMLKEYWLGVAEVTAVSVGMTAFSLAFFYLYRRKLGYTQNRQMPSELSSLLAISICLPILISCFISAAFDLYEGRPFNDGNMVRYLIPCFVPAVWFLMMKTKRKEVIA